MGVHGCVSAGRVCATRVYDAVSASGVYRCGGDEALVHHFHARILQLTIDCIAHDGMYSAAVGTPANAKYAPSSRGFILGSESVSLSQSSVTERFLKDMTASVFWLAWLVRLQSRQMESGHTTGERVGAVSVGGCKRRRSYSRYHVGK